MAKFKWTEKDRFILNMSILVGLSTGILSATLISSVYAFILYPTKTNALIYAINWIIIGVFLIFFVVKVKKYEKMMK